MTNIVVDSESTIQRTEKETSLLHFEPEEFRSKFHRTPFLIDHRISDHRLFDIDRLLELAGRLPESCIEYNAGDLPISVDHSATPGNGLSPEETIRRIEKCQSWLVLKHVQQDSAYKALLESCLEEIKPLTESITPGMMNPQAFVFITSPGSVTPYHIDPEHNFLLQIQGSKTVHQFDGNNRQLLTEEELEDFYCDRGRNLTFDDSYLKQSWKFELPAGKGLHFPVTFPHYVENGNEVSISFSITFRTPDLDRRRAVYQINNKLRHWGMNPPPVGDSQRRDLWMYQTYRVGRKISSLLKNPSSKDN